MTEKSNNQLTKFKNMSFEKIFILILISISIVMAFYGSNVTRYTSSQIDLFLFINHKLSSMPTFWDNLTAYGDGLTLFPLLSFLIFKKTIAWAAIFGAIPLACLFSHLGKYLFEMPRPAAIIDNEIMFIVGQALTGHTSLPSGHTITVVTAIAAIICVLIYDKKMPKRMLWCVGLALFAALTALSRVAVGAHWPADLLLGTVFGILAGCSGAYLAFKYTAWWNWMTLAKFRYVHVTLLFIVCVAMLIEYHMLLISWLSFLVACITFVRLLMPQTSCKLGYENVSN